MNNSSIKFSPRVSVVMPVYNVALYIEEAIDSILSQTYEDFELIVIDDSSTDNTREIVSSYKDPRVILIKNEIKSGIANILNIAIKQARGEFIARMDGDDISLPNRLQIQIDFLDNNPSIALCSCALKMFGSDDKVWIREANFENIKISMFFHSPILHATSVFRKDVFIKNNLFYNQDTFPAEDYDLWSRSVLKCELINIPNILYLYRIHNYQTTNDLNKVNVIRDIKIKYLLSTISDYEVNEAEQFVDNFIDGKGLIKNNYKDLELLYRRVIELNERKHFFSSDLLEKRLKRHYQNQLFLNISKSGFKKYSLSIFFKLRFSQVIKLCVSAFRKIIKVNFR